MKEPKHVRLEYWDGFSDKVYAINLQEGESENEWTVICIYGRRGNVRNHALKTPIPVSYGEAREIYDKLLDQKLKKGYEIAE